MRLLYRVFWGTVFVYFLSFTCFYITEITYKTLRKIFKSVLTNQNTLVEGGVSVGKTALYIASM
jgi:hypothetical protein